jgi:hypothetical protein
MDNHAKMAMLLVLLAGFSVMTGCAFGTRQVPLVYPPERASEDPGPKIAKAAGTVPVAGQPIILLPFTDQRADKRLIGEVRNGWGMRTADVVTDRDIVDWVTRAVAMELENAGYQVVPVDRMSPFDNTPTLTGDLVTVYCTALFSYEGEVSFFAKVERDGQELLKKRYTGKGSAGLNWAATESSYGQSLSLALSEGIRSLIADLKAALKS